MFARLGWKKLAGANTLAYYENYGQRKFHNTGPGKVNDKVFKKTFKNKIFLVLFLVENFGVNVER